LGINIRSILESDDLLSWGCGDRPGDRSTDRSIDQPI
jgi:hypothetical protein